MVIFWARLGCGLTVSQAQAVCPVLMWKCWHHGGRIWRGHPAPQLCMLEPVFSVTLLHAVLCSWAFALGLCRWGEKLAVLDPAGASLEVSILFLLSRHLLHNI